MTATSIAVAAVADLAELVALVTARHLTVPRNLSKLATDAAAAGWTVTPEVGMGWLAVSLTGRVQFGRGSVAAGLRCIWRENGKGGFRWDSAERYRDGELDREGIAWGSVNGWVERATAVLVDPAAEADDVTFEGRGAAEWLAVTNAHGETAAEAYERGRNVRDRIKGMLGHWLPLRECGPDGDLSLRAESVPAWVDAVDDATFGPFRRLDRRSVRVNDIERALRWEIAEAGDEKRTPGARRAAELAGRARVLADGCAAEADALESMLLDAEAEALCAPYVDAIMDEMEESEREWRAANPTADVRKFAGAVIQTIGDADIRFSEWWAKRNTPGMTYWQGWNTWQAERGQATGAETHASVQLYGETDRAILAVAEEFAARAKYTDDAEQQQRAAQIAEAAQRGAALLAPGARPQRNEISDIASRLWGLMCGRGVWGGGRTMDTAADLETAAEWNADTDELRRLLLIRHGLDVRGRAGAAVREELKAEESRRGEIARTAYYAARTAGASEESAHAAGADARARYEADAEGRPADGRERFERGAYVWVGPAADTANEPYVASVLGYTRNGAFEVREPARGMVVHVPGDRLSPATTEEAETDRARREREREEQDAERERRNAAARAAAAEADRLRKVREERQRARTEAARGTEARIAMNGAWAPEFSVPASIDELWKLAACMGWRMTRQTTGTGYSSSIIVTIGGTTDAGVWRFGLVWTVSRGRYSVNKAAGWATWADERTGPRGGRIDPTIGDVKSIMYTETNEGIAAPLGVLVGVDGPQADTGTDDTDGTDGDDTPGGGVEPDVDPTNGPAAPAPVEPTVEEPATPAAPVVEGNVEPPAAETSATSAELDRDTASTRPADAPAAVPAPVEPVVEEPAVPAADPRAAEEARRRRSPYLSGGIPRVTLAQLAAEREQREAAPLRHRARVTTGSGKAGEYLGRRGTDGLCWVLLDGDTYPVTARLAEVRPVVEPPVEGAQDARTSGELDRGAAIERPVPAGDTAGPEPTPKALAEEEARLRRRAAYRITEETGRAAWREAGEAIGAQRRAERGPDPEFLGVLVEGEDVAPMNPGWAQAWWLLRDSHGFGYEINQRKQWHVMAQVGVILGTSIPARLENLGRFDTIEDALAAVREHAQQRAEAEAGTILVERIKRLAAAPAAPRPPVESAAPPVEAAPLADVRAVVEAEVRVAVARPADGPSPAGAAGADRPGLAAPAGVEAVVERAVEAAFERIVEAAVERVLARLGQPPASGGPTVAVAAEAVERVLAEADPAPAGGQAGGGRHGRRRSGRPARARRGAGRRRDNRARSR
ncbi:hypothetical protein ACFWNL_18490 [Kitasatospora sp. NPDC058397]|uniref:hypothetical protein n=1 Tax=unclassified Kitasatospora TaxID=2633591 RepID=UPI0036514898